MEFYRPLTIITGANGTGKSTIIEALKYATTGLLPPGMGAKAGQSFIYDPELAQTSEVKASIRLLFKNLKHQNMFVSRNFKVTQKKEKREFKALDGLLKSRNAAKQDISQNMRCSDLDQMIPSQLGVSPAILDNVIFTHQTESDWPLRESTELKKRFDDIFESSRYTKALAEIRKVKKTVQDKAKDADRDKEVLATHKGRADLLRTELQDMEGQRDKLVKMRQELTDEVQAMDKELAELLAEVNASKKERDDIKTTEAVIQERKRTMERLVKEVGDKIEETMSLADYQRQQRDLEDKVASSNKDLTTIKTQIQSTEIDRQHASNDVDKLTSERISLQARQEESNRHWKRLETCIADARSSYPAHVKGTIKDTKEVRMQFQQAVNDRAKLLADAEKEKQAVYDRITKLLDEERSKKAIMDSQIAALENQRETLRKQDKTVKETLETLGDDVTTADERLKDNARRVTELDDVMTHFGLDEFVAKKQQVVDECEAKMAKLQEDRGVCEQQVTALEKQQDAVARLNSKIQDSKTRMTRCNANLDALQKAFEMALDDLFMAAAPATTTMSSPSSTMPAVDRNDLLTRFHHAQWLGRAEQEEESPSKRMKVAVVPDTQPVGSDTTAAAPSTPAQAQRQDIEYVLKNWSMQTQKRKGELDKKREELRAGHDELAQVVGRENEIKTEMDKLRKEKDDLSSHAAIKDLKALLSSVDGDVTKLEDILVREFEQAASEQKMGNAVLFFQRSMMRMELDDVCTTCGQSLDHVTSQTPDEHVEVVVELDSSQKKIFVFDPSQPVHGKKAAQYLVAKKVLTAQKGSEAQKQTFAEVKSRLDTFRREVPKYQRIQSLEQRINDLAERMRIQNEQKDKIKLMVAGLKKQEQDLNSRLSELIRVENELVDLLRMARECEHAEDAVQRETQILTSRAGGASSSSSKSGLMTLEEARANLHKFNQNATMISKKKEEEQKLIQLKREEYQKLLKEANDIRSKMQQLEKQVAKRAELMKEKKKLSDLLADIHQNQTKIKTQGEPVERAIKAREDERKIAMDEATRDVQSKREELNKCQRELNTMEDTRQAYEQAIEGNVPQMLQEKTAKLEQAKKTLEKAKNDVADLYSKLRAAESVVRNAEAGKDKTLQLMRYARMKHELDEEETKLRNLIAKVSLGKSGVKTTEEEITKKQQQVSGKKLQAEKLMGKLEAANERVKAITSQLKDNQLKDIDRRYNEKVFEATTTAKAVKDLDRYFKALDQALMKFHGAKIAEINTRIAELWQLIYRGGDIDRIELRAERTTTSAVSTYSYRVVMRKNHTELDMRGRSSAGQRVLASLVIRLALAETFSVNCGILCLDEPTTNLDDENKKGLAIALADLIKSKKNQDNFQLIIITHDQDWVQVIHDAAGQGSPLGEGFYQLQRKEREGRYVSVIQHKDWSET